MNYNKSLQANEYFENLNKHGNCSKCNIVLTQDNCKKGRTVCNLCYNKKVLAYFKIKFCPYSSPKTDASTHTDFSDEVDRFNRQDISIEQVSSNK